MEPFLVILMIIQLINLYMNITTVYEIKISKKKQSTHVTQRLYPVRISSGRNARAPFGL